MLNCERRDIFPRKRILVRVLGGEHTDFILWGCSHVNAVSSWRRKFLGLILAVTLVFSIFPVSAIRAAEQPLDVDFYASVAFQNDLNLVYYCKINTPGSFKNLRLCVSFQKFSGESSTCTWEDREITDYTYNETTGEYRFVYRGIAASEMGNLLKCTLRAELGNQTYASVEKEFSVQQYAKKILATKAGSTKESDKLLSALVVDMLNYGAAAQLHFKKNTGSLANATLTSQERALADTLVTSMDSCQQVTSQTGSTVTYTGVSLAFKNTVDLVAYVTMPSAPKSSVYAEVSYTGYNGNPISTRVYSENFTYNTTTKEYRVAFNNVSALYFREPLKVIFKDGDKVISPVLTYSYESYGKAILAGNYSSTMKELVKYMMTYSDAAYKYFVCLNGSGIADIEYDGIHTYKNSKYTTELPESVIVISASATAEEQYAAYLLQYFIAQEDGYTPTILTDATAPGSAFEISVGNTNRSSEAPSSPKEGSYRIKSYSNGISITGNGKRGTIDGAMKFLSVCGGYYWLSFEDGYRTNQNHFKYDSNINIDHERVFTFTDTDVLFGKTSQNMNRLYSLASAMNGFYVNVNVMNQPGAEKWYLSTATEEAYGGLQPGQAHTLLAEYITKDEFAEHPDWFGLYIEKKDGQIVFNDRIDKQLCLSNPRVYERIRDHVFEILESDAYDPNAPMQIINLGQADNEYYCMCSECYQFRMDHEVPENKEGLCDAALYLDLCNRISREVKATGKYPNVYIDMLAYTYNLKPPVGMEMDDHVIIRYAAISRCYAHDCDDAECDRNREEIEYLKGWANLCDTYGGQLWIWDYVVNFSCTAGPYMNLGSLAHDIKYYRDLGVKGIYLQNNDSPGAINTEFGDLRNYLIGVLLENPDADVEKEMEFFVTEFYGASGPYILEAMRLMEKQAKNHAPGPNAKPNGYYHRDKCTTYSSATSQVFANVYPAKMDAHNEMPQEDLERCEALWNKALEVAAGDTAENQRRTGRTHLCWRWTKSCMKVYEFEDPDTYVAMNEQLHTDLYTTYGMTFYALNSRKKPGKAYLYHTPDRWTSSKAWEEVKGYEHLKKG